MRRFHEVVEQRLGPGEYVIQLTEQPSLGGIRRLSPNSGLSKYRAHLTLGTYHSTGRITPRRGLGITSQEGGLLSTAAGVGTSVAVASSIGAWAGPVGAAAGAIVGIIAGLFEASAARAKDAKAENAAINEYLPAWDQSLQAIFQQASAGTISAAAAISALQSLMPYWWQAAAQFKGLPGVADASSGGSNCGTYISGSTTPCSPTGGPNCDKSCTAFCCVGCRDLMPAIADAVRIFGLPGGGTVNVCEVYGSSYGATQRNGYSLTYTPPAPAATATVAGVAVPTTAAGVASTVASSVSALTGISSSSTIAGIPIWLLIALGAAVAVKELL